MKRPSWAEVWANAYCASVSTGLGYIYPEDVADTALKKFKEREKRGDFEQ